VFVKNEYDGEAALPPAELTTGSYKLIFEIDGKTGPEWEVPFRLAKQPPSIAPAPK
jgi:hypothetical protein